MTDDVIDTKIAIALGRYGTIEEAAKRLFWTSEEDQGRFIQRRREQDFRLLRDMLREAHERAEQTKRYIAGTG